MAAISFQIIYRSRSHFNVFPASQKLAAILKNASYVKAYYYL